MRIRKIETYFPTNTYTTDMLLHEFPEWSLDSVQEKIGINKRYYSGDNEYASDMAVSSAEKLFRSGVDKNDIDYLILCTQSPDYLLPATACIIQNRLGLRSTIGAIDINIGCSGYIYALSLAYGLIKSNQVKNILIVTSDTYTKYLDSKDRSVKAIFSDAATATLVTKEKDHSANAYFVFGTDGSGAKNLILENSGTRGLFQDRKNLSKLNMNGPEIVNFILNTVPQAYDRLILESQASYESIKYHIFHQANKQLLEALRKKLNIQSDQFIIDMAEYGNTVSSTIPIAISNLLHAGRVLDNDSLLLFGFGVGYSWAGCILNLK